MGGVLFGETLSVVGMPQANLLFLAALLEQVAVPFLLPGKTANSFSRKFQASVPFMITVQGEAATIFLKCFLIKASGVYTFLRPKAA